jgi:hypothetical protein
MKWHGPGHQIGLPDAEKTLGRMGRDGVGRGWTGVRMEAELPLFAREHLMRTQILDGKAPE